MLQHITDQLESLQERKLQASKLEGRLRELSKQLAEEERRKVKLSVALDKEQADVDRLEGLSLAGLFYAVIGIKSDKLDTEKEEALRAKLQLNACRGEIERLKEELRPIREELSELGHIDREIARLTADKERLMLESDHPFSERLNELIEERAAAGALLRELKEAVSAGRSAVHSLQQASESLSSAKSWGTYDMLGGGLIATHIKRSRIDDAHDAVLAAQISIRRFAQELKDLRQPIDVSVESGGMLSFADYFFDGLITDWMVQGTIDRSFESVQSALSQIRDKLAAVETRLRQQEQLAEGLKYEHARLIETG